MRSDNSMLKLVKENHYIRKASSVNYWFDFTNNVLKKYLRKNNKDFCLVILGSDGFSNCYVIPFADVTQIFHEKSSDDRGRWTGTIVNDVLRVPSANLAIDVSQYFNRLDLLEQKFLYEEFSNDLETLNAEKGSREVEVIGLIAKFNSFFKSASPTRKMAISERISRPGSISNLVKNLRNHTCQICNQPGFEKRNGGKYSEAHHIEELHKLIPGSLCSDNIIVVCANCHRKLHFAKIDLVSIDDVNIEIAINNEKPVVMERNVLSNLVLEK